MRVTFGRMDAPPPIPSSRPKVVLSRTDRLGDLLLTIPAANLLSQARPDLEIVFLVRRYAAPLLSHHDPPYPAWILEEAPPLDKAQAIVHVYPRLHLAWRAFRAGIPHRIGTSRRWYHWLLCNIRPSVARRHSFQHESLLNLYLLKSLLPSSDWQRIQEMQLEDLLPYRARLRPSTPLPTPLQETLSRHPLRIGIHIGGSGGAPFWPTSSWISLVEILRLRYPEALFVFTGNEAEKPLIEPIAEHLPSTQALRTEGLLSLPQLITLISQLNVFLSGSTGPLHIAAALDVPTLSVFPATAAMGPWRWKPLSPYAQVFAQKEVCRRCTYPRTCLCLARIEPLRLADALPAALQLKRPQLSQQP